MYLTAFDPYRDFRALEKRMMEPFNVKEKEGGISSFTPSVNTREGEFAYHVDVDLPGVKKEDIKVDVKDGNITISGERNFKEEVKEEDYYKVETSFGKFSRSFSLPEDADTENITASTDNGVLEVVIPKVDASVKTKSIEVK
ncbi:Hsp20/alpha crystallin family protein [Sulfurimonas marina]|uniref:Hsp20/alpha crystallin family protein n=1 Tax=Sulfurimonas marina TaxID=2590551 RepID=A0A7M1AUK6_9BACT|nr:Hsp20/alpha crystallin family protein [Sulfurimonas marina]QOP41104.1 Hsp20/alpha crystallin family protein [Sulfurimonas marina]